MGMGMGRHHNKTASFTALDMLSPTCGRAGTRAHLVGDYKGLVIHDYYDKVSMVLDVNTDVITYVLTPLPVPDLPVSV